LRYLDGALLEIELGIMKKIVVIGTGYVGLPAALMWAQAGVEVLGVDIDERVVKSLNEHTLPIEEAELEGLFAEPVVRANLTASMAPTQADVFVIAVPTPIDPLRKVADLRAVESATRSITPYLCPGNLVIVESTIPPRTCRDVVKPIIEQTTGLHVPEDVMLAHCPERIMPGDIYREIVENERIVGGLDEESTKHAVEVYRVFVKGALHETDDVTAELVKLMENASRDINIAMANEFAAIAEGLGAEADKVIALANRHPRVNILRPGIGVGGHCIPVDPWFLKEMAPYDSRLIATARAINDEKPSRVAAQIRAQVRGVTRPKVVLLGASYKRNTRDTRESPSMAIAAQLRSEGLEVVHLDPLIAGMDYESLPEALSGAHLVAVLVAHDEVVAQLGDWDHASAQMARPEILWLDS
jgi:UDP-N-acetyl-D-mannosaminuronic acid dehydrogenase